jgi:cullin 1
VLHSLVTCRAGGHEPLELYRVVFERRFLDATRDYFDVLASHLRANITTTEYMTKVLGVLEGERTRCDRLLVAESRALVISVCQERMVAAHQDMLHAEARALMRAECATGRCN